MCLNEVFATQPRKVPGLSPGQFPQLNHPNWAVVVTHSALGLRELFEQFQQGMASDVIKDAPLEKPVRPILAAAYEAGETVLRLSNTSTVKPGDVLEVRVPVIVEEQQSFRFSLAQELRQSGDLTVVSANETLTIPVNGTANLETEDSKTEPHLLALPNTGQQIPLPWQQEVEAIAHKLFEIRSVKTYQVQVEAVLDNQKVQIMPSWSDIPQGAEISKRRISIEVPEANFLHHVGLDWQVLIEGELLSYQEYKKRTVLQQRGMSLDAAGEIVVGGVRLKDTLPPAAFELFIKGLEAELATAEVEVPHSDQVARPDKAKLEIQARYGTQVKGMIQDLFKQRGLIRDGASGQSLVERPVKLLEQAITRVQEKGHEANFANNSALIHAAVFGFVKEQTGRGWSEHSCEDHYQEAVNLARRFVLQLQEQLRWRSWR